MIRILMLVMTTSLLMCNGSIPTAGTETETHTGMVKGVVYDDHTSGAADVPVTLHFLDADTTVSFASVTDQDGRFAFDSLPVGEYMAEATALPLAAATRFPVIRDETSEVTARMVPVGAITGKLCIPFLDRILTVSAVIREINRSIIVDSTGYFLITALPAYDDYSLAFQSLNFDDAAPFEIIRIDVPSGDTVNVGNIALFTGNARIRAVRLENDTLSSRAEVVITGRDMLAMRESAEVRQTEVYAAIEDIPEGMDRIFTVSVYDAEDVLLSTGSDTVDVWADSTVEMVVELSAVVQGE